MFNQMPSFSLLKRGDLHTTRHLYLSSVNTDYIRPHEKGPQQRAHADTMFQAIPGKSLKTRKVWHGIGIRPTGQGG